MSFPDAAWLPDGVRVGYHTLRRMQFRQLAGIGIRKSRALLMPQIPVDFDGRYEQRVPESPSLRLDPMAETVDQLRTSLSQQTRTWYRKRAEQAATGSPTFLSRTLRIAEGKNVDWYDSRFSELPGLWSFKLYAFQPLSWLCRGIDSNDEDAPMLRETFDGWIRDWTNSIQIGRSGYLRRAWTPWSVSLRILHWCQYLAWRKTSGLTGNVDDLLNVVSRELYKNVLFLANHIERDVGGNHLIENGTALAIAGVMFSEESWREAGLSILSNAAAEQFLADGCHFERSPMYHLIVLTRYLTVCSVFDHAGRSVPDPVQTTANEATAFLQYLRPPDGRIPLLNDSVYGQSLPLDDCLQYANALDIGSWNDGHEEPSIGPGSRTPVSEYQWLGTADGTMLVDGGKVGPPHLPGHSHSDTLSVLVWLGEHPVMTDTGTYNYVRGWHRDYARSVRGHNTVQVGDIEPIALGGRYMMGPRPEPETRFVDAGMSLFEGRYDATPIGGTGYTHHRAIYASDDWWTVWDTVEGHQGSPVRSRLHFHPDISAAIDVTGRVRLVTDDGTALGFVYPLGPTRVGIDAGWYFPRFGEAVQRSVLNLEFDGTGAGKASFGFLITGRDLEGLPTESSDLMSILERLCADGETLPAVRLLPS